jgi:hypothetical protein
LESATHRADNNEFDLLRQGELVLEVLGELITLRAKAEFSEAGIVDVIVLWDISALDHASGCCGGLMSDIWRNISIVSTSDRGRH